VKISEEGPVFGIKSVPNERANEMYLEIAHGNSLEVEMVIVAEQVRNSMCRQPG